MKSMKLSAIVLGLAAAGAFAQAAPAAAPAAEPATQPTAEAPKADSTAAQPAADQPAAEQQAATAETAKAEPKPAEAAPAAEPAAAQPAATQPAAAPVEEKNEELVKAEEPLAEEPKAEEKQQESAQLSLADRRNISKADDAPEPKSAKEFKVSGAVEFDAYAYWRNDDEKDLYHDYWSTFDLDFQVKFNEQWSAQVELEADGQNTSPGAIYNGAFVQYQHSENLAVKFGDMTYSEGGFNYYDYNDPADYAAGMKEHDIRGIELNLYGLQLALGFGRGSNDNTVCNANAECKGKSYDAHAAYQFDFAGQALRPFAHYKSWQEPKANELHTGLEAALEFGPFAIHAVYGLHADALTEDEPKATHAFLAEPVFKVSNVNIKAGFFYAIFDDDLSKATIHDSEIPEYMFAYGEGDIKLNDAFTVGLLGELHTNSLDDDTDLGSLNFGTRLYFTPVDGLEVTGFAMAILPMGNDWEKNGHEDFVSTVDYGEDLNLYFGVETVFSF